MRFDIGRDGFPLLTTKRVFWRGVAEELLWFISGSTNARDLEDKGIEIWREWGDPETRELGPIYGKQLREFTGVSRETIGYGEGTFTGEFLFVVDQLQDTINQIKADPYSRRHVITLWNPAQIEEMALPPCHGNIIQFYVDADERLNLFMHQRSGDMFLGVPFNIASYSLLLSMVAHVVGREPGEFIHSIGDVHLYSNHIEQALEQLEREPKELPTLVLQGPKDTIDGWNLDLISLIGYDPHPPIKAEVTA